MKRKVTLLQCFSANLGCYRWLCVKLYRTHERLTPYFVIFFCTLGFPSHISLPALHFVASVSLLFLVHCSPFIDFPGSCTLLFGNKHLSDRHGSSMRLSSVLLFPSCLSIATLLQLAQVTTNSLHHF